MGARSDGGQTSAQERLSNAFVSGNAAGWTKVPDKVCKKCKNPAYEHRDVPSRMGCAECRMVAIPAHFEEST